MNRRRFLKATLGGLAGICLPLSAIPHAKPSPLRLLPTHPSVWKRIEEHRRHVRGHTMVLRWTITKEDIRKAQQPGAFVKAMKCEVETMVKDFTDHMAYVTGPDYEG